MNHLFRLACVAILALTFSGRPVPVNSVIPVSNNSDAADSSAEDLKSTRVENGESIPWTSERRLSWEDFLCKPERGTDAVASTSTSLGLAYKVEKGKLSYSITCDFSKHKSWGLLKNDYILAHEQGHFDITEIYARKLHQALMEYEVNPRTFKKDLSTIYQNIVQEKEDMQESYDGETDHSRRKSVQLEWHEKIQQMLKDTEPFADYP